MAPPSDDGPELLLREEVCRRLRMDSETLKRLIKRGLFPEPLHTSDGIQVWTDEDVRAHKYRIANAHRFRARAAADADPDATPPPPAGRKKQPGQPRVTGGQPRVTGGQPEPEPE